MARLAALLVLASAGAVMPALLPSRPGALSARGSVFASKLRPAGAPLRPRAAAPVMVIDPVSSALAAGDAPSTAASYYATLGLFVLTFPGIISQVTRATKAKVKRKTYELPGPAVPDAKPIKQVAAEVVAHFQANNYKIKEAGETIVFEGKVMGTNGQAAFLTFCTFMSLGSLSLVLSILEKQAFGEGGGVQLGNLWYLTTLLSPLAGKYYLDNAERSQEVEVKLEISDDDKHIDLTIQGDEPELERAQERLQLMEKGMEFVPGILS